MKRWLFSVVMLLFFGGALFLGARNASGQQYYRHAFLWDKVKGMQDLGTLGGNYSWAKAINAAGQVVGQSYDASGYERAFLWNREHGMRDLGTLGGNHSWATAINSVGQVVGYAQYAVGQGHAFLWDKDHGMQDLGTLGGDQSTATAINAAGQVTGYAALEDCSPYEGCAVEHAFIWDYENGTRDLGTLGGNISWATAINSDGQVVGWSTTVNGEWHAFLWDKEHGMQDLGTLGGESSGAAAINAAGQVVGWSLDASGQGHAFLWDKENGVRALVPPGGQSAAVAINDAGQVVGNDYYYTSGGPFHAFLWDQEEGVQDIGTLGGEYSEARALNDAGQVVGASPLASGHRHAFLWDKEQGVQDLGVLGGDKAEKAQSEAVAINDAGQVIGTSEWEETAPKHIWIEAETGRLQAPMKTGTSSGVGFIWAPPGSGNVTDPTMKSGSAQFSFSVPTTGKYAVWARVLAPHGGANSFFVSLDGLQYRAYHICTSPNWVWRRVESRHMNAGSHSLVIKHREQGTRLDKLLFTSDLNYVPSN